MSARHAVPTAILAIVLAGCAIGSAPSARPVTDSPSNPADAIPTACFGLVAEECAGARDVALSTLEAGDPAPVYIQVGPFGCLVEGCPQTLVARPEGDVMIEFPAGGAISIHLKALPDGSIESTPGNSFGVAVEAGSARSAVSGATPYTLGHCGLFSGIDFDGSFWDPVGPVNPDHGDAINAADGLITLTDPDHGSFVSRGGLTVQLRRHAGAKHLPLCA